MKIAIQGIQWCFHEMAARKFFWDQPLEIIGKKNFEELVNAVVKEETEYGVIAIENTIAGTIHPNLNLLRNKKTFICGEVFIRIKQNLAVIPWTKIEELKEVHSHYMALNQTRKFFQEYPFIQLVDVEDTALAIKQVSEKKDRSIGAVWSELAAEMYGLEVIGKSIETNKKNYTRFFVIQKEKKEKSDFNKSSLSFVASNEVGGLSKILAIISAYGIDLTKIESQPILWEPFHYRFYIDVRFQNTQRYYEMLQAIKPLLREIDILGEYQEDQSGREEIQA